MAVLPIRIFPDSVLRRRSHPAQWSAPELKGFLRDLQDTLYAQRGGIGIAAPQVGMEKNLIIVDVSPKDPRSRMEIMINPEIRWSQGEILSREGCMSLPDYTANVKRAARLLVEWTDTKGKRRKNIAFGIEAICLQHEIDHLMGMLFIDRVVSLKTDVYPRGRRSPKPRS